MSSPLFALVRDDKEPIRRVPLTSELQEEVAGIFSKQKQAFLKEVEAVPFDPAWKLDDGEIFEVSDFALPETIADAINQPLECSLLGSSVDAIGSIKGLFSGTIKGGKSIAFQAFDARRSLTAKGLTIFYSSNTYRKLESPGLTLDTKPVAVIDGNRLLFESYFVARRVLDLTESYVEATEAQVVQFANTGALLATDVAEFEELADSWVRRKIASILESKILEGRSARSLATAASTFGVSATIVKQGGSERLQLPNEKRELKALLRFLDEDFFEAPLTKTKFLTSSKRKV